MNDDEQTQTDILLETRGHTAIMRLNNPPAHTWTPASLGRLEATVQALNADPHNYALIITGEGDKFFSAGADLKHFDHDDPARCAEFARAFGDAFRTLSEYRGVSFAAINGFAMGGGLEAALACDVRVAASHAVMALPECSVGLLPCGLGTQLLPLLVGEQWAKRMILLGEKIPAEQALAIGLISEIVAPGNALERALALSEKLSQQSPIAVNYCKQLIMGAREQTLNALFAKERSLFMELFATQDRKEGVRAFLEKRSPKWVNK